MRAVRLIGIVFAVAAVGFGAVALAAAPAWDISGAWTSYIGNLSVKQAADGSLTGTFTMKVGCTDTYNVGGKVDGSAVTIALTRMGGGDLGACAGTQSLKGTVDAGGATMQLALVNAHATSPATPFTGKAKKAGATATTTTAAKATTTTKTSSTTAKTNATATLTVGAAKQFSVFVVCGAPHKQLCPTLYTVGVKTPAGVLRARFITSNGHCSDVRLRLSVDGGGASASAFIGRSVATPWYAFPVSAGTHVLSLQAEGRPGGCNNTGYLKQWAGQLELRLTS